MTNKGDTWFLDNDNSDDFLLGQLPVDRNDDANTVDHREISGHPGILILADHGDWLALLAEIQEGGAEGVHVGLKLPKAHRLICGGRVFLAQKGGLVPESFHAGGQHLLQITDPSHVVEGDVFHDRSSAGH